MASASADSTRHSLTFLRTHHMAPWDSCIASALSRGGHIGIQAATLANGLFGKTYNLDLLGPGGKRSLLLAVSNNGDAGAGGMAVGVNVDLIQPDGIDH
jgi:hypothetical protein